MDDEAKDTKKVPDSGDISYDTTDAEVNSSSRGAVDTDNLDDSVVAEEVTAATVKKLRGELKKAIAEKQEYLTLWQKDKAEFVNARKRDNESQKEIIRYSNEALITELLPVLDSFGMAFGNKEAWEKVDKNWRIGVEYIANQLKKVLEDNGVVEINPVGLPFDPMRDEAVEFEPVTDEKQNNCITTVISKGYSYNSKTLKAPKVKVGEFKKA